MGVNCRCKDCELDFIDQYGEFMNEENVLECPRCKSENIICGYNLPNFKPAHIDFTIEHVIDELITIQNLYKEKDKLVDKFVAFLKPHYKELRDPNYVIELYFSEDKKRVLVLYWNAEKLNRDTLELEIEEIKKYMWEEKV